MSQTSYQVSVEPAIGYAVRSQKAMNVSGAIQLAEEWATEFVGTENRVFISFFRSDNGMHGFINRDGASVTGKNWATV